ncbi:hypothetical protein BN1708_020107 [Verticillium longisporum]|uniref:Uncharacterized protein n=1 Tax=Verticillium longisporum TaxID=100787 RepID=A0A0G4MRD5_VERLO|nr:hypothetical protein BN1708_020107 [Verticillium longisporum]
MPTSSRNGCTSRKLTSKTLPSTNTRN